MPMSMQYLLPSCYIHTTRYYPLLPATLLSLAVHSLHLLLIILTPDLHCVPPLLWSLLGLFSASLLLYSALTPLLSSLSPRAAYTLAYTLAYALAYALAPILALVLTT